MELFGLYRAILIDLAVTVDENTTILDWGCGSGELVTEGRCAGFNLVGCDFGASGPHLSSIDSEDYRLPYSDNSVDVVISNQVLEHVMDYDRSLAELRRILKPGGAFLHMFPARMIPIEPHVFVPCATIIRCRAWLLFWALLGVRNSFQRNMSPLARMRSNHTYLHTHTNYLRRRDILHYFERHFSEVRFVEHIFLRHHRPMLAHVPFAAPLYNVFKARVVFGRA